MEKINKLYELIIFYGLDGEQVANLFLNYYGTQLLTDEFIEDIIEELYG